ncbi:MAG: hypothetical protein JWM68_5851 [Verrucomicrobiales bacterium]|nr:hypothetical protein [Verrucomicrobiales bacterium]
MPVPPKRKAGPVHLHNQNAVVFPMGVVIGMVSVGRNREVGLQKGL